MIQPLAKMREVQFMYGGPSFGNFQIGIVKGINVRVLSRQDSFDTNLDPHAPFPLDASRAALPLPAQLASSRSFGHAPHRRLHDRERGAPTPEDILESRVRSRSPGSPGYLCS